MKLFKIWSFMFISIMALVFFSCSGDPTCTDGEQNGGETGIDCGGPCIPCDSIGTVTPIDTTDTTTNPTPMFSCDTLLCAKVNGVDFVGEITTAEEDGSIILTGTKGDEELAIYYDGPREAGAYDFEMTVGQYINGALSYEAIGDQGIITISSIDTVARTISGTFEFTASSTDGSVEITDGAFNQLTYE